MARNITLDRTTAEWLVDLLEEADPRKVGTWRIDLSQEIRQKFGMIEMDGYENVRKETVDFIQSNNNYTNNH